MAKKRTMDPVGKRAAVLAAGEQLFAAQGYTNTAMADIARSAGVAVGTVYRLFPDKPTLLASLHQDMEQRFIDALERGWDQEASFDAKFGPMIDALFDEAAKVGDRMPLYSSTRDMIGAVAHVPGANMISTIERLYRQGVAAGAFRTFASNAHATLAHAMVEGAFRAWMSEPTLPRRRLIADELKALFRRSFLAD